jgi:hypothetical protein
VKPLYEAEAQQRMRLGKNDPQANLPEGQARDLAAARMNVSGRSVGSAEKVRQDGIPALVEAAENGQVSVSAAEQIAKLPLEQQAEVLAGGPKAVKTTAKQLRQASASRRTGRKKTSNTNSSASEEPVPESAAEVESPTVPAQETSDPLIAQLDQTFGVLPARVQKLDPTMPCGVWVRIALGA